MLCRWIDNAHDRLDIIPSLSLRSSFIQRNSALFNMEVSIMESLDWRLSSSSKLSPSASGLLFLTGQMHNLPEDCIQVCTVSFNAIGNFLRFANICLLFDHVLGAGIAPPHRLNAHDS